MVLRVVAYNGSRVSMDKYDHKAHLSIRNHIENNYRTKDIANRLKLTFRNLNNSDYTERKN